MDDMCKLPLDYMKKLDELISNIKNTEGELKPNDFLRLKFLVLANLVTETSTWFQYILENNNNTVL